MIMLQISWRERRWTKF